MSEKKQEQPESSKLITGRQDLPCGCVTTEYADGQKQRLLCQQCGLFHTANCLNNAAMALAEAANALASIATGIKRRGEQRVLSAVSSAVAKSRT